MSRSPETRSNEANADRIMVNIDGFQELSAIREALDGIRQDVDWWINNHRGEQWLPIQPFTTMPTDPVASPSTASTKTHPGDDSRRSSRGPMTHPEPLTRTARAPTQGLDDETQFCCESPDLQWTGDPLFPGVACMHCGYTVADCGSVVMQPSSEADPDPEPKEQQRGLFAEE